MHRQIKMRLFEQNAFLHCWPAFCRCQPFRIPLTRGFQLQLTLRPHAYPFFEATTRVLVKVLAGVNAGVHVLDEVVGGLDAARRVADAVGAECRRGARVPPEIDTRI